MPRLALAFAVAATVALAGCADFLNFGGRDCEIKPGSFSCRLGGAGEIDLDESWENNASRAEVTVQMGGSGSINVTILDADGTVVFEESYSTESGGAQETRTTDEGTPGDWQVQVEGSYQGGMQVEITSV